MAKRKKIDSGLKEVHGWILVLTTKYLSRKGLDDAWFTHNGAESKTNEVQMFSRLLEDFEADLDSLVVEVDPKYGIQLSDYLINDFQIFHRGFYSHARAQEDLIFERYDSTSFKNYLDDALDLLLKFRKNVYDRCLMLDRKYDFKYHEIKYSEASLAILFNLLYQKGAIGTDDNLSYIGSHINMLTGFKGAYMGQNIGKDDPSEIVNLTLQDAKSILKLLESLLDEVTKIKEVKTLEKKPD